MFRRLLQNTAISAVAYGLAGVLGLLSVGVIARAYGVAVLGLIVLVRSFLPAAFLALIDFGVSELATQAVARGRVADWKAAGERISLLTVIAAVTGVASGLALWFGANPLSIVFKVAPEYTDAFISILRVTALFLPILFSGLIAEGILKGFEYYGWLRTTEVASNLAYVASVFILAWYRADFEWLAYAYLATIVAKYFILAIVVHRLAYQSSLKFRRWGASIRHDTLHRCWLMFNSRIGGTFQQPLPPLAIGILFGPAEVGSFDLITRLPRFLKATMAPLYGAILPVSTHIDETTDSRRLQMLGRSGLVLPSAFIVPALIVVAFFSKDILRLWVGQQHASQWPWLALSLCIPAVTSMLGAGQAALIVRSEFLRFNTRLMYLQIAIQYLITFAFVFWLREKAFILGWSISYVVFAPPLARYMLRQMNLSFSLFWQQLARLAVVASLLIVACFVYRLFFLPGNLTSLLVSGALACILAWTLSIGIVLSPNDRALFSRFIEAVPLRKWLA